MKDALIFTFHREGCTIARCTDGVCEEVARLSAYDLLRQLPIDPARLFAFMHFGTEAYFYPSQQEESIQVPQAFYDAFGKAGEP